MDQQKENPVKNDVPKTTKEQQEDITSRAIRAGKRTYFFDVKSTRGGDYYLTITESKKRMGKEGQAFYEKHKIFLYKEDFDKFSEGLQEVIDFIRTNNPSAEKPSSVKDQGDDQVFPKIDFDDLEK